jgi:hypothetical protein
MKDTFVTGAATGAASFAEAAAVATAAIATQITSEAMRLKLSFVMCPPGLDLVETAIAERPELQSVQGTNLCRQQIAVER